MTTNGIEVMQKRDLLALLEPFDETMPIVIDAENQDDEQLKDMGEAVGDLELLKEEYERFVQLDKPEETAKIITKIMDAIDDVKDKWQDVPENPFGQNYILSVQRNDKRQIEITCGQ